MFRSRLLNSSLSLSLSLLDSLPFPGRTSLLPRKVKVTRFCCSVILATAFFLSVNAAFLSPAQLHLPLSTLILAACGFSDRSHPANTPPPPGLLPILVQRSCQHHLGHKLHATHFHLLHTSQLFLERKGGKGFRDPYHPSHLFIRSFVQV